MIVIIETIEKEAEAGVVVGVQEVQERFEAIILESISHIELGQGLQEKEIFPGDQGHVHDLVAHVLVHITVRLSEPVTEKTRK